MKKLMLPFCFIFCLGGGSANLSAHDFPRPPYEIPKGMTEHDFAVWHIGRMLGGEINAPVARSEIWEDLSQEEQLAILHVRDERTKFNSLGNDVKLSAYKEVLVSNMDNPESVKQHPMEAFFYLDGRNLTSCGDQEALLLTREVISRGMEVPWLALLYLTIKGNGDDVGLIDKAKCQIFEENRQELADALRTRAERNFVRRGGHIPNRLLQAEWSLIPSVANTGPQGVYAYYILRKAGDREEYWTKNEAGLNHPNFPDDLMKMMITFDEDGNPVSNVDLEKYGLSMPVITLKAYHHNPPYWDDYIVTFPHETEATAPTPPQVTEPIPDIEPTSPTDTTQAPPPPEQPQATPKNKNPLWLGILVFLAVIGGMTTWLFRKK